MRQDDAQPGSRSANCRIFAPAALLSTFLCAGCANPGPPKPPSLHLPQVVKDLTAERIGDHVLLRWTTPSRTSDDMQIKGVMTAEVCRETGARPATPVARAAACVAVRKFAVNSGPSEVVDTLPPALQADPVILLTYRIQIYNSTGHSAGESNGAFAAAGSVPQGIASLRAKTSEAGAVLEWQHASEAGSSAAAYIDLTRTDLASPPSPTAPPRAAQRDRPAANQLPGKKKAATAGKPNRETAGEVHLRARENQPGTASGTAGTVDTSGTVDTTATMGDTYSYQAERVRQVTAGSHALEIRSDPSPIITLAMADTFPPRTPTGLATISGVSRPYSDPANAVNVTSGPQAVLYVDLSWEPNAEADLAGYRVYRQLARPDGSPQGPLARLTAVPIAAPSYRDVAVRAGQGYIYSVTAVDAAGNESAPSAKVLETTSRDPAESPK